MTTRQHRERAPGGPAIPVLLALLLSLLAAPAVAAHSRTGTASKTHSSPGDDFFESGLVPRLKIEIKGTNLTALQRDNRAYVRATVRESDKVYKDVGIHLKGAAGSFRDLNDNPALTLNFDKFEDHNKFHGLEKIHLNNSVQDPTCMTELLCGDLFRAAGVPAARTTHARVELNGRDLGLYVLKEGFNKAFIRRYFKNADGNLYDGGFLREITEPLQKMSGNEPNDYAHLKALVAAAEEPDPAKRLAGFERLLDFDRFLSFIAMEIMTWHWDGYAMKRNNYRVYHDPDSDKIVFFAHGMDQMFWEPRGSIMTPNLEGLVARSVLEIPEGRIRYREKVATLLTNVFKVEALTNRMNQVQARIRPVLAAMSPDRAREHDEAVNRLREQIIRRIADITRQISLPEPKQLKFDASGAALLTDWHQQARLESATLDQAAHADRPQTLHIRAGSDGECTASWRTKVLLPIGSYRLEGEVCTSGVVPLSDLKGEGAGLRYSGSRNPRQNKLSGDSAWQKLEYRFVVPTEATEVELVCELRATKGEAWFDLQSLHVVRRTQSAPSVR